MLDLTMLKEPGVKFYVRCPDEESTLNFLREMKVQYPEHCTNWTGRENQWTESGNNHIDYFPYINNCGDNRLRWNGGDWGEDNGYRRIDYYDIPGARCIDLGDVERGDMSLEALF